MHNEYHVVHTPASGEAVERLFLFIPGTTAIPAYYLELLAEAADLGYHVIGLTYPNRESLNRDICPGVPDSACFFDARWEILTGEPTFEGLDIDRANSIEGRLESLLAFLAADEPDGGWEAYRLPRGAPDWSRIAVSGHSQGGGHAGLIAKTYSVARCIMFGATDWWIAGARPTDWILSPGATPAERHYGFTHVLDEAVSPVIQVPTWEAYGMRAFGGPIEVESVPAPRYRDSHMLFSTRLIDFGGETNGNYHNALCVDVALARDTNGIPLVRPVWRYLLDPPPAPAALVTKGLHDFVLASLPAYSNRVGVYLYEGDTPFYVFETNLTRQTVLPMASATKWIAGATMLAAAEAGHIDLDDPIAAHVPAFAIPGKDAITIRHAFNMTAGMDATNLVQKGYHRNPAYTHEQSVALIASELPMVQTPGEVIHYLGAGMQAAGLAAVYATGLPDWHAVAETFLLGPLGLTNTAFSDFLPNPAVAGGVETTPDDYLRFLRMLVHNGAAGERGIVASRSVLEFFSADGRDKPITASPFPETSPYYPYGRQPYYSFGAWVLADNPGTREVEEITSPGAYGTFPWIDRRRGLWGLIATQVPAGTGQGIEPALGIFHHARLAYDAARPERVPDVMLGTEGDGRMDPEIRRGGNELVFQDTAGSIWFGLLDPATGLLREESLERIDTNATPLLISWNGPEFAADDAGWSVIYNKRVGSLPQLWQASPTPTGWTVAALYTNTTGAFRSTFLAHQATNLTEKWVMYVREESGNAVLNAASLNAPAVEYPLVVFGPRQPSHAQFLAGRAAILFATGEAETNGTLTRFDLPGGAPSLLLATNLSVSLPFSIEAPELDGELVIGVVLDGERLAVLRDFRGAGWSIVGETGLPAEALDGGYTAFSSPEAFAFGGRSFVSVAIERPGTGIGNVEEAQVWVIALPLPGTEPLALRTDSRIEPLLRTDPEFHVTPGEVFIVVNVINEALQYEIHRTRSGLGPLFMSPGKVRIELLSDHALVSWDNDRSATLQTGTNLHDWTDLPAYTSPWVEPIKEAGSVRYWRTRSRTDF